MKILGRKISTFIHRLNCDLLFIKNFFIIITYSKNKMSQNRTSLENIEEEEI